MHHHPARSQNQNHQPKRSLQNPQDSCEQMSSEKSLKGSRPRRRLRKPMLKQWAVGLRLCGVTAEVAGWRCWSRWTSRKQGLLTRMRGTGHGVEETSRKTRQQSELNESRRRNTPLLRGGLTM